MSQRTLIAAAIVSVLAGCWTGASAPVEPALPPTASSPVEPTAASGETDANASTPPTTAPTTAAPTPPTATSTSTTATSTAPRKPAASPAQGDVEPFASLIRNKYRDRQDVVRKELQWLAKTSADFDAAWAPYEARLRAVEAAVSKAESLTAAGKRGDARVVLEGVITHVPANDKGELPSKRKMIEVRDAELAAVFALARIVEAQGDIYQLASLGAELFVRRRVLDAETERKIWITAADPERVLGLAAGDTQDVFAKIKELRACAHEASYDGQTLLGRYNDSLRDDIEVGLVTFHKPRNTKGAWVLLSVKPSSVDANKVAFKRTDRWVEEYDCKKTNRIESYDPVFQEVPLRDELQAAPEVAAHHPRCGARGSTS